MAPEHQDHQDDMAEDLDHILDQIDLGKGWAWAGGPGAITKITPSRPKWRKFRYQAMAGWPEMDLEKQIEFFRKASPSDSEKWILEQSLRSFVDNENGSLIFAKRHDSSDWEGFFFAKHYVEGEEDGSISYNVSAKLIYVTPKTRGCGLADIMLDALMAQVKLDIGCLVRDLNQLEHRPNFEPWLLVEAMSDGGQVLSDRLKNRLKSRFSKNIGYDRVDKLQSCC